MSRSKPGTEFSDTAWSISIDPPVPVKPQVPPTDIRSSTSGQSKNTPTTRKQPGPAPFHAGPGSEAVVRVDTWVGPPCQSVNDDYGHNSTIIHLSINSA